MASGTISSMAAPSISSASRQPNWAIRPADTGTIKNCPNDPAAAVMPIAQERFSGDTLRVITP